MKSMTGQEVKTLTEKEMEVLTEALDWFEHQFACADDVETDIFNYDDEWIDIEAHFVEDDSEQYKLERSLLSSGKTPQEIAETM